MRKTITDEFRKFSVPEMLPMLHLTIGHRCKRFFELTQLNFYLIVCVGVLEDLRGAAFNSTMVTLTGIHKQHIQFHMETLTYFEYVVRKEKNRRLSFTLTKKGRKVAVKYQQLYRKEILRLRTYGINFEDL